MTYDTDPPPIDQNSTEVGLAASTLIAIFQSGHACATWTKDFYNKQIIEFVIVNDEDFHFEATPAKNSLPHVFG